jgi:hypothetical protein
MARPVGSPLTVGIVKLYIPGDWVLRQGKHRYVFIDAIGQKVSKLSVQICGSTKIYQRFQQALSRERYNQKPLYGLRAIDIDQPQKADIAVSVRLEIIVGEGEDSYERVWSS